MHKLVNPFLKNSFKSSFVNPFKGNTSRFSNNLYNVPNQIKSNQVLFYSTTTSFNNNNNNNSSNGNSHQSGNSSRSNNHNNGYQYQQQQQQYKFSTAASKSLKPFVGIGGVLAISATTALSSPVLCESTLKELDNRFATIPVEEYEEIKHLRKKSSFQRFLGITTLSGVLGYSSGFATRKIGMFVIFVVGSIFTLIQVLSYYNYLTIHWERIFREVNPKFDKENRSRYFRTFINILTNNLHVKAGFLSGFYLGFKK
ncbi:hypothetical protein CYY_003535 [Polysphondylium violaceum]|uniref:FUN14 family protein n=1 Tax=Polysphondylium violaceum TaxID=133409 RepID=A0A8J4PWK6_9MYCE|nr:hypothetical protein CYY_003535 [Polysphondylium violaceum]